MSYDYQRRIADIDRQITWLEQQILRGEYIGAGVTLGLTIGPRSDDSDGKTLELTHDLETIMPAILGSLKKSRASVLAMARVEHKRLQELLDKEQK